MPNFTKIAIKNAFWKLLNEQPLNQITVRSIVEECGINRNSFYYHFQDIPSLIEEIIKDTADAIIEKYPSINSLDEAVNVAFHFALENKKAVKHICNSVNRNIYEHYFMNICDYVVRTYFNTVFGDENISDEDKNSIIIFWKCELFGISTDWISNGMNDDAIVKLKEIVALSEGTIDKMIENCKNK